MQFWNVNTEKRTPEIERRSVTSCYHGSKIFLDNNNMELSNDDDNGNENGKKAIDLN